MGSFSNSIHVKCDDANDVVASIKNAMRAAGHDATDEQPDQDAMWDMSAPLRAMHVSRSRNGWVGLLDSDLVNSASLASDLSQRLETCVIQFMVNDSESWHYVLFRHGSQVDGFASSVGLAGEYEVDAVSPEAEAAAVQMLSGDGLEQRMREMMEHLMPADILDIDQRVEQGTATQKEMRQLSEWFETETQRMKGKLNEMNPGTMPSLDGPSVPDAELSSHVEHLRLILPPDVTDSRILEVLGKQDVLFAEKILGEFMELLGVQPFYADFSYHDLEECGETDLLKADVETVAHLKFKTDTILR